MINAGRLDPGSWYLNEDLEGSRFAGEGGHFIDTLSALVGQHPVEAYAMGAGGNVHSTLRFADGSVATVSYVTDGSSRFRKRPWMWSLMAAMGGWTTSSGSRCGRPRASRSPGICWAGQGSDPAGALCTRRAYRREMPIPLESLGDHTRDGRRGKQSVVRKAGYLVSRPGAGWYIRRLRGMSPTEIFYRALDAGRRQIWARRQVHRGDRRYHLVS